MKGNSKQKQHTNKNIFSFKNFLNHEWDIINTTTNLGLTTQNLHHKNFQQHNFYVIEATVKKGNLTIL